MSATVREKIDLIAASRPREIEDWSNLYAIHPLSRIPITSE
mgnify:CR=1 FL=1